MESDTTSILGLVEKKNDAIQIYKPLATGTAISASCALFSVIAWFHVRSLSISWLTFKNTLAQLNLLVITVSFIIVFAYLFNYSCKSKVDFQKDIELKRAIHCKGFGILLVTSFRL